MERLDRTSAAYGVDISAEKSKLMTNNTGGMRRDIRANGQKLETVNRFNYPGALATDEGSKPEVL